MLLDCENLSRRKRAPRSVHGFVSHRFLKRQKPRTHKEKRKWKTIKSTMSSRSSKPTKRMLKTAGIRSAPVSSTATGPSTSSWTPIRPTAGYRSGSGGIRKNLNRDWGRGTSPILFITYLPATSWVNRSKILAEG